jgi:hypothetical protein
VQTRSKHARKHASLTGRILQAQVRSSVLAWPRQAPAKLTCHVTPVATTSRQWLLLHTLDGAVMIACLSDILSCKPQYICRAL